MRNNETTKGRLDVIDEKIRKYYIHTLRQQGITVSEKQCAQAMKALSSQNSYGVWLPYMGYHNNPLVPMKGKIAFLHMCMEVDREETKDFLSQLIMFSKGYYDEKLVKAGLVKVGLKSGTKIALNTKRSKVGRRMFNNLNYANKIMEAFDMADIFYSATYIYLLNRQVQNHSQQHSVRESLNAYTFWLNEKNEAFLGMFK